MKSIYEKTRELMENACQPPAPATGPSAPQTAPEASTEADRGVLVASSSRLDTLERMLREIGEALTFVLDGGRAKADYEVLHAALAQVNEAQSLLTAQPEPEYCPETPYGICAGVVHRIGEIVDDWRKSHGG